MKKIIFGMAAFLAFGAANAQSDEMKFGVKAGVQFTNIVYSFDDSDDELESDDGKAGFFVGGFVDLPIAGKFHLQPELMLSMEGAKDADLTYLRVPVMAKYYFFEGFSAQAGPELAFRVAADDGLDDATKSFDFGIGIGAAYELPMGLMFDLRYNQGLADISDFDGVSAVNTGFQIGVGYRF